MRRHRTTARGVLFLAAILGLAAGTADAAAPKVPDHIIFPVVGHPDDCVTVHLGYGRTRGGQTGTGNGFNANAIRTTAAPWFDRVDIVISNAAIGVLKPALELTLKHFRRCMETNALALNTLAQLAVPMMPGGGRIIAATGFGDVFAADGFPDFFGCFARAFFAARDFAVLEVPILRTI